MNLVTEIWGSKNDPATLKLHIACNYAKIKPIINFSEPNSSHSKEGKFLPYVKTSNGEIIFIPNAALGYIIPISDRDANKVHEYLEIESNQLAFNLAVIFGSSPKSHKFKNKLMDSLKKLDKECSDKSFLIGENVTSPDISIWSVLYPLYKSEKLFKEYLLDKNNLVSWLQKLEQLPEFKDAVTVVFPPNIDIGVSSYQTLMQGARFVIPQLESEPVQPQAELDVQKNEIESITDEEIEAAKKSWQKNSNQLPKLKKREKIILPKPNEKNILITSALPYVNNVPHLGNIIGCVLSADVFARFCRLCNINTLYISGTDEYGTATETKALEEGLSCQAICDKYFKIHDEIYKWFDISFDCFGRTSKPEQTELSQEIFLQLNHNGFTFTESVEQLHCEKCDRYLADRFVEGGCPNVGCTYPDARGDQCDGCGKLVNAAELKNPRCKICGNTPKLKTSSQFFIDLTKIEPLLHHWFKLSSPGWSHNAEVITKAWLKEGLKPRCITRDLKWGVPVPLDGYRNKVFYVWFDAPIGYISISKSYTEDFEKWWKPEKGTDIKLFQFMAKDNVPFHSVLFPAMLLGANKGYLTVSHIMATEYLNYEDGKFSKSRGVGVFGNDARDTGIPSDVWRFYLLSVRPESQDSSFGWSDLAVRNNSELLNNLGNFVNRALMFAKNSFNKIVPKMVLNRDDYALLALCTRELRSYMASLEKAKLREGIKYLLSISKHGNQYIQSHQPWVLVKGNDQDKTRAGTVVGISCNLACLLAILLEPYMPQTSANLKKQLNCIDFPLDPHNVEIITLLPSGHQLGEPYPLFSKIEIATVEELKKKFAGKQDTRSSSKKEVKAVVLTPNNSQIPNGDVNPEDAKSLKEEITKQGLLVRELKEGGDKSVWQPEVTKLLQLKAQLAAVLGVPLQANQKSKKGKK